MGVENFNFRNVDLNQWFNIYPAFKCDFMYP